jgi:rRNA maturation RNase YbeY
MLPDKIEINSELNEPMSIIDIRALEKTHKSLQLNKGVIIEIVTDEELLEINRAALNHDYYTDIITFDYTDDDDIEAHEIVISWDRVKENAETYNQTWKQELHRVCIHGLLHLAGHSDKTSEEQEKMRGLEDYYIDLHCST